MLMLCVCREGRDLRSASGDNTSGEIRTRTQPGLNLKLYSIRINNWYQIKHVDFKRKTPWISHIFVCCSLYCIRIRKYLTWGWTVVHFWASKTSFTLTSLKGQESQNSWRKVDWSVSRNTSSYIVDYFSETGRYYTLFYYYVSDI